jgi:hypothetical protein
VLDIYDVIEMTHGRLQNLLLGVVLVEGNSKGASDLALHPARSGAGSRGLTQSSS